MLCSSKYLANKVEYVVQKDGGRRLVIPIADP